MNQTQSLLDQKQLLIVSDYDSPAWQAASSGTPSHEFGGSRDAPRTHEEVRIGPKLQKIRLALWIVRLGKDHAVSPTAEVDKEH